MGVVYKLLPQIKEFILQTKELNPELSCRKLATLTSEKFQRKIAKSSINSLTKSAGLSMPVGRRYRKRRGIEEGAGLGAIFLKAADYLVGGTSRLVELIRRSLNTNDKLLRAKTEFLLFSPLFDPSPEARLRTDYGLWQLIGKRITSNVVSSYLFDIESVTNIVSEFERIISSAFREIHYIKINFTDGSFVYLDGQFHSLWLAQGIPVILASTLSSTISYINSCLSGDTPLILLAPQNDGAPDKHFFHMISGFEGKAKGVSSVSLYGGRSEELSTIIANVPNKKRFFITGLWPWQFAEYRKVKIIGDFSSFYFEPLRNNFYIAESEVIITQPSDNTSVTLRGCALKTSLTDKIKLIILTNLTREEVKLNDLAAIYLNKWPNIDSSLQDLTRKIELFAYTAASRHRFSLESFELHPDKSQNLISLLGVYLEALDHYTKWYFFPSELKNTPYQMMKDHFYSLSVRLKKQKSRIYATIKVPDEYSRQSELEYACQRFNERTVYFQDKRLWLNSSKEK